MFLIINRESPGNFSISGGMVLSNKYFKTSILFMILFETGRLIVAETLPGGGCILNLFLPIAIPVKMQ